MACALAVLCLPPAAPSVFNGRAPSAVLALRAAPGAGSLPPGTPRVCPSLPPLLALLPCAASAGLVGPALGGSSSSGARKRRPSRERGESSTPSWMPGKSTRSCSGAPQIYHTMQPCTWSLASPDNAYAIPDSKSTANCFRRGQA